jgi:hypothetical protein
MSSAFSTAAKNAMLGGITPDTVRLHSGDPGAAGVSNAISGASQAATFAAASGAARALSADVAFTGLTASQSVTWYSIWGSSDTVYLGKGQITTGDVQANAAGQYTLAAASTSLSLTDPP